MEDYKKKYEQLTKFIKDLYNETIVSTPTAKWTCEYIFPELKESEDEKLREQVVYAINQLHVCECTKDKLLAWLEKQGKNEEINEASYRAGIKRVLDNPESYGLAKQGEQISTDKVEPKFKVGDWVIHHRDNSSVDIMYVYNIRDGRYYFNDNVHFSWSVKECDEKCHLWTIQDAKDGDVLAASDGSIFIFKEIVDCGCKHYIALEKDNETINVNDNLKHFWETVRGVKPATKEQRDLLFQKMKEDGYEWDVEKKELKKIEQKSAWSEDDERKINGIVMVLKSWDSYHVCSVGLPSLIPQYISWLDSLKERIKGE